VQSRGGRYLAFGSPYVHKNYEANEQAELLPPNAFGGVPMFFEIDADDITRLDSKQLVELMRRLLLAECRLVGVPLRAATAPIQITVADGGEDGRVDWKAGADATDYFPSRFCIFQSKAQNITASTIAKEIIAKSPAAKRKKKTATKEVAKKRGVQLNDAVSAVLKRKGAYIVFCSHAFTGKKIAALQAAIVKQIRKAGKLPSRASAIEIYDANRIADWTNTHPAASLWLASKTRGRSLGGFLSHEAWGRSAEIKRIPWVAAGGRFTLSKSRDAEAKNPLQFAEAAELVSEKLSGGGTVALRVAGPSGFGKTRFAYELFNCATIADEANRAAVIYADFSIVGNEVQVLALELAEDGRSAILVVDECPDAEHGKLRDAARREGSRLRIITIDVETKVAESSDTLVMRVEPASDATIGDIAAAAAPTIGDSEKRLIQELAKGFPKMAVLAAQEQGKPGAAINSAADLVDRIVWGRNPRNDEAQRALETLSLFEWVGFEGKVSAESQFIAKKLAGMSLDAFVEKINSFKSRGILVQRGDFIQVAPIPLAASVGGRRLSLLPAGKLKTFFLEAPETLRKSLLRRLRWLDSSPEAKQFAKALLASDCLGNFGSLSTDVGAEYLDRLFHVDPEVATETIRRVFSDLPEAELQRIAGGRRYLVWALEKVAFREEGFTVGATLLRRLAACETEERISNNATGQFKQLYQLYLSGTCAAPAARLAVLDEGLRSGNAREREVCVGALDRMLDTHDFTRTSEAEEIGSGERLVDWAPKTRLDILTFLGAAIDRLIAVANNRRDPLSEDAKSILGKHIRGLLSAMPLTIVKNMISQVSQPREVWLQALQEVNEWLYFDRKAAPKEVAESVRAYFDELLPSEPIDLVIMYTHGWAADFHDPDVNYKPEDNDFDYAARKAVELADAIAKKPALIAKAVARLVTSDAKSPGAFASRLASQVNDTVALCRSAIKALEGSAGEPNLAFIRGLISGADSVSSKAARECAWHALKSKKLKGNALQLIASKKLNADDIKLVVSLVKSGNIPPWQCGPLSYGRGTEHLSDGAMLLLLNELAAHGPEGLWAALDILSMTIYGGKDIGARMVAFMKKALVTPTLFEKLNRGNMDGHHLEVLVKYLHRKKLLDKTFARKLIKQLLSICLPSRSKVFHELDGPAQKCLTILMESYPREVWSAVSPMLLQQSGIVRHRLRSLMEMDRRDHLKGGLLAALPPDLYLDWARKDPTKRASLVVEWLPVALQREDGSLYWHPALEAFINEFGLQPYVLGAVMRRLHPRTSWGSLVPYLENQITLLSSWQNHAIPEIRAWADRQIYLLREEIRTEEKRDAETEVRLFS
jgi:hypothetical protein